jgi:hypothetical protein
MASGCLPPPWCRGNGGSGLSTWPLPTPEQDSSWEVARRHVEIVHTEGDRVLVQGMVQPGDQVIPSGTHRVVPGQGVRVEGGG